MDAVLNGPNGPTQLGPTSVTLGRTPDNQIVVNDGKASSQHAEIRPSGQGYTITDLGSTNGTFVNGQRLDRNMPRMLMSGDTIRIGDTTYTYQAQNYQQPGMYAAAPSSNYDPTQLAPQQPFQATSYGGPPAGSGRAGGYQPTQLASAGSGYQPTMPAYPQYDQQYNQQYNQPYNPSNSSPQQGYMPPPPPAGQSGASLYDQNSAPTQQASYVAGGAGVPSSPYNMNQSYTPGAPAYNPNNPMPGYSGQAGSYLPPGPPQGPSGRKRNPLLTIVLVAIALLVIIGAISTFLLVRNNQVATDNRNSTATASAQQGNANATGTAMSQATGQANATASAQAQNANPYTNGGTLAMEDALKDNSGGHGWEEDANCQFKENVYEVNESHQNTFFTCDAKSTNYNNITFEVSLKIIQGDCAGTAFRANLSNDAEYFFEMCQDGTYDLVMYDGTNAKYLINNTSSSAIKSGIGQINTLGVVANSSNIQLFINGTSVDQTQDSTYSGGSIGLLAINHSSSSTLVAFAGVRVWTL